MVIIPAIDIKDGKCIRLQQGRLGTESIYSDDPVAVARRWESEGAELIHVVDLDGAFSGSPKNRNQILKIVQSVKIPIQAAGGIRTFLDIENYRRIGASRLVLGTKALQSFEFLKSACDLFPGGISVGLDAREGKILVQGWTQPTGEGVIEFAKKLGGLRILSIIFTDVQQDGMLQGPNLDAIRELAHSVEIPVIASGGVSSLEDIRSLCELESSGVAGIIIGKALYTGTVNLREALMIGRGAV
ncbi:MAG TPA: 1-(5-phosphoribosyl)-5-[(5-phosphoribosylamino)methylideneamino]imidazole-4-carboxamide isomerase [Nitrospiria bacterium]|nr:1-(5-phosphoribosyl)-5-[(5-phosphoribosylamino)methylideneamino]imidazole-4-carboxamide isomerase [Nitrospiria bacterium]